MITNNITTNIKPLKVNTITSGGLDKNVETDPIFRHSPAYWITSDDISNWNAASGGIDMSAYVTKSELVAQAYLTSESDPVFSASPAAGITTQDIQNWNAGGAVDLSSYVTHDYLSAQAYLTSVTFPDYSNTYQAKGNYLTNETDPVFANSPAGSITHTDIANWNAAAGTIDMGAYVTKNELVTQSYITINDVVFPDYSNTYQAKGNYLTNETDPVFSASPAAGITAQDIENWNTGASVDLSSYVTKSELSTQSYLTSETDPVFSASPAAGITAQDIQNWNAGSGVDLNAYVKKSGSVSQTVTVSDYFNDGEYKQKALTTTVQSTNNYGYYAQTKVEMVRQANGDYQPRVRIETHGDNGELADVQIYEDHVSIDATDVTIGAPFTYMENAMITYNGARDYVASYNYVANQLANYDLSSYVTKSELSAQSYLTSVTFPDYSSTYQAKGNYLTTETDPVFSASPAAGITAQDIQNWNTGASVDLSSYVTKSELVAQSYLTSVTFPDYSSTYQAKGNYLTSETDPVFSASPAAGITTQDIQNWNTGASVDLSSYVTKSELSAQSYVTNTQIQNYGYTTVRLVTQAQYQDQQDDILYVITDADPISGGDLSAYVQKTELSAQAYVTNTALDGMAYVTNATVTHPNYFTTYTSYAYFYSYINSKLGDIETLLSQI